TDPAIDTDRIRDILAAGWREWTESGPLAQVPLDDLDLGFAKLRADRVDWQKAYLATSFAPAGIAIRNLTEQAITYQIKGPYSGWGGPYTLEPEQHHDYGIAYPVTCRFRSPSGAKQYTLPPG